MKTLKQRSATTTQVVIDSKFGELYSLERWVTINTVKEWLQAYKNAEHRHNTIWELVIDELIEELEQ